MGKFILKWEAMGPPCFFCGKREVSDQQEGMQGTESLIGLLEEENLINFLNTPQAVNEKHQACYDCFTMAFRLARLTNQLSELKKTIVENFSRKSTEDYREETLRSGTEESSTDGDGLLCKLLDCQKCDKKFRSLKGYNNHSKKHENNANNKETFCAECNRTFSTARQCVRHQFTVHRVILPILCTTCGQKFDSEKSLARHIKEVHSLNVLCDICDKMFFTTANLAVHKKTIHCQVTSECAFFCEFCPERFSSSQQLKQHQKRHIRSTYQCNWCDRTFKWDSSLNCHMQAAHLNTSVFQCTECGRRFKDKNNLRKHAYTHSGAKPHHCTRCNKGFIRKDLLKRHEASCAFELSIDPTEKPHIRTYVKSKSINR